MKISVISENITRQEFFDFYSLEYAYANHQDPEIEKNLDYLAGYILQDHLEQFSSIDRLWSLMVKITSSNISHLLIRRLFLIPLTNFFRKPMSRISTRHPTLSSPFFK